MSVSSVMLLPATNAKFNVTGDPQRADGYWGATSTTHTISIHVHQFTGRIYIEASLAETPLEEDWFPIYLGHTTPYVQYRDTSKVDAYTFRANVSWLRARLDRSYLTGKEPTNSDDLAPYGVVFQILLNH